MKPHEFTQGCTDDMLGPRITVRRLPPNLLPLDDGILDCDLCGHRSASGEVIYTVLKDWPERVALRCADVHSCLARRPRR